HPSARTRSLPEKPRPLMVGSVPNPQYGRIGVDGARPLAVRFAELRARALKEIPENDIGRQALSLYVSEQNYDLLYEAIENSKRRRAPVEPSPQLRAEWDALDELIRNFNRACLQLRDSQKWLSRAADDWRHRLLGHLTADMFTVSAQL